MKKTVRLTLRLEPDVLDHLQAVAKKQERSAASQALHFIKEGLKLLESPTPSARAEFGFAAEGTAPYKIPKK